jgi:hypothetical protein
MEARGVKIGYIHYLQSVERVGMLYLESYQVLVVRWDANDRHYHRYLMTIVPPRYTDESRKVCPPSSHH